MITEIVSYLDLIAEYEYDGSSKRIQKTEWIESIQNYQTLVYMYSGSNVIYEKNPGTGQEATYVFGPMGRIAKIVDGLRDYYHTDHLGSSRLITDESGNVLTDVEYEPFGTSRGEYEERYLYTGKERDATGLTYFGARYYNSETGRFLTRDPVTGNTHIPQSLNRYIYCLNNPLKYTDPLGLSEEGSYSHQFPRPDGEDVKEMWDRLGNIMRWVRRGLLTLKEAIIYFLGGIANKILQSYSETGLLNLSQFYFLLSALETIVHFFGDTLGITGAFICLEGMGTGFFGVQGGVCLVYHPDLGWAMYLYGGILVGSMLAAGVSIIVGFWTWHGEKEFTFDDWTRWFYGPEITGGAKLSVTLFKFANKKVAELINATITGWGFGIGAGVGFGAAWSSTYYMRAPNWMIPYWLKGIVVPKGD